MALAALAMAACVEPSPRPAPASTPPSPAPAATPNTPTLERLAKVERRLESFALPRVVSPKAHERVAAAQASAYPVSLEAVATLANASLMLSLDGGRPRPLAMFATSPKLGELTDAGTLADGPHVLLALYVGEGGVAVGAPEGQPSVTRVAFFVGDARAAPPLPRIACLSPWGTLYGARAASTWLDFLPLDGVMSSVEVTLTGASGTRHALAEGIGPFQLGDLPSGDYELRLDPAGSRDAAAVPCVFTVNREIEGSR